MGRRRKRHHSAAKGSQVVENLIRQLEPDVEKLHIWGLQFVREISSAYMGRAAEAEAGGAPFLEDDYYKLGFNVRILYRDELLSTGYDPPPPLASDYLRLSVWHGGKVIKYGYKAIDSVQARLQNRIYVKGECKPSFSLHPDEAPEFGLINQLLDNPDVPPEVRGQLAGLSSNLRQMQEAQQAVLQAVWKADRLAGKSAGSACADPREFLAPLLLDLRRIVQNFQRDVQTERRRRQFDPGWATKSLAGWPIYNDAMASVLWGSAVSSGRADDASVWVRRYLELMQGTQYRIPLHSRLPVLYRALRSLRGISLGTGTEKLLGELTRQTREYEQKCIRLPAWAVSGAPHREGAFHFLQHISKQRSQILRTSKNLLQMLGPLPQTADARRMLTALIHDLAWSDPAAEKELMRQAADIWGSGWPTMAANAYLRDVAWCRRRIDAFAWELKNNSARPDPLKALRRDAEQDIEQALGHLNTLSPVYASAARRLFESTYAHAYYKAGPRPFDPAPTPECLADLLCEGHPSLSPLRDRLREANQSVFSSLGALVGAETLNRLFAPPDDPIFHCMEHDVLDQILPTRWKARQYTQRPLKLELAVREWMPREPNAPNPGPRMEVWDGQGVLADLSLPAIESISLPPGLLPRPPDHELMVGPLADRLASSAPTHDIHTYAGAARACQDRPLMERHIQALVAQSCGTSALVADDRYRGALVRVDGKIFERLPLALGDSMSHQKALESCLKRRPAQRLIRDLCAMRISDVAQRRVVHWDQTKYAKINACLRNMR